MFLTNSQPSRSKRIAEAFPLGFSLNLHTLLLTHVGSIAHGTGISSDDPHHIDDVDVMGVFCPPRAYFSRQLLRDDRRMEHWVWQQDELDVVAYSVHKYARLALKGNPNVLTLLWQPRSLDLVAHPIWETWREQRDAFLSLRVRDSFSGYALGQLKRLGHPNTRGYMGKERKALFEQYHYDVKNGAHCVRLLRMGLELLETGRLNIDRSQIDADELKAIKTGQWSLGRIEREADRAMARYEAAAKATSLPEKPDTERVLALVERTLDVFWKGV